jgi:hypothetical protein
MGRIGCQRSHRKPICHLLSAVEPERRPDSHRSNLGYSSSWAASNGRAVGRIPFNPPSRMDRRVKVNPP